VFILFYVCYIIRSHILHPGLVLWMRGNIPKATPTWHDASKKQSIFQSVSDPPPAPFEKGALLARSPHCFCNFPAVSARVCDWIAGTPGGAIQVRDLSLPTQPTPLVRLKNRLQNRHARNLLSSKFAGLQEDGNKTTSAQRWSGPNSGARTVPRE
jgi:hypothetical protein